MNIKSNIFILLILNTFNSLKVDYDETISGEWEKIYTYSLSKAKTFLIKRLNSNKKYFEITNFYVSYELFKGENLIYKGEENSKEEYSYYFEHDGSEYYLKLTKTNTYPPGGINIRSSNENLILY